MLEVAYSGNDPVNNVDPEGLMVKQAIDLAKLTWILITKQGAKQTVKQEVKQEVKQTSKDSVPKIADAYKRPSNATTKAQRESVQGKPCVDCGKTADKQVADHKTPLVKEYYRDGKIDKEKMRSLDAVQPQCPTCSSKQGAEMSRYSRQMKKDLDL